MSKEGEGMFFVGDTGCPEHAKKMLYRKNIDGLWYEVCSVQGCNYKDIVLKERRQNHPILFMDRRRNG